MAILETSQGFFVEVDAEGVIERTIPNDPANKDYQEEVVPLLARGEMKSYVPPAPSDDMRLADSEKVMVDGIDILTQALIDKGTLEGADLDSRFLAGVTERQAIRNE